MRRLHPTIRRATDDGSTPTVAQSRSRRVDAFAAALALLLLKLRAGQLSQAAYEQQYRALWQSSLADVTAQAGAQYDVPDPTRVIQGGPAGSVMSRLATAAERFAVWAATETLAKAALGTTATGAVQPSDVQIASWGNQAAGSLHAAHFVADGYAAASRLGSTRQLVGTWEGPDDENTCNSCGALNGMSWPLDSIPEWPGSSELDCSGNCRCEITFDDQPGEVTLADDTQED